jgi:hypothetical protein
MIGIEELKEYENAEASKELGEDPRYLLFLVTNDLEKAYTLLWDKGDIQSARKIRLALEGITTILKLLEKEIK